VLCELVPGGISKEITAGKAARVREEAEPSGAVALARCALAAEFPGDLRRIDAQMPGTTKRLTVAVRASGTTLTEIFGAGPVIAATMTGYVAGASRFPSRDNFAACNGTAPVEVSPGNRKIYRLSRRGNRRLNHAVHMAAVTQRTWRASKRSRCSWIGPGRPGPAWQSALPRWQRSRRSAFTWTASRWPWNWPRRELAR
jgi:transposase